MTDPVREAFERWLRASDTDFDYETEEDMWLAWQAATAAMSQWQTIDTAPKGSCVGEDAGSRGHSEWFLGLSRLNKRIIQIRRLPDMNSYTFGDKEETHYDDNFFTHWMPLPANPTNEQEKP
jgi:hypothetical protein